MPDWYKDLQSIPVLTGAEFLPNDAIKFTTSTQDFTRNEKRKFFHAGVLTPGGDAVITPPQELSQDIKFTATSPSGKLTGRLMETGKKKRFVEVWANEVLLASTEVTDLHEDFYTDDFMGIISFSPSETSLVYLAEAKAPKSTEDDLTARFRYKPSLGESLLDRYRPTIFNFSWQTDESASVAPVSIASEVAPQVHFFSVPTFLDDDTLIAVGHELTPEGHLPSVRWCHNRPIAIWKLALDRTSKESVTVVAASTLSDVTRAGRSPRVYTDSTGKANVLWLDHARGGPHASCSSLLTTVDPGTETRTLVPYISNPKAGEFPGLFVGWGLLARPFLQLDGKVSVLCTSSSGARTTVLMVDAEDSRDTVELTPADDDLWSYTLLATDGKDRILCSRSSFICPPQLVLGHVESPTSSVSWRVIWQPPTPSHVRKALADLKISILPVSYPVESIILQPKNKVLSGPKQPLLSIIHGGPHGASSTTFSVMTVALALQGYTISLPNYTGSAGYGGDHIDALIGKCGSRDVQDVVDSIKAAVDAGIAAYGEGNQFCWGGSHGGFLGAHLVGQHPDLFSAAVLSNPVITTLPAETDIPDWYFEEFMRPAPTGLVREQLPPDVYAKLYAMSPISHVENVKSPVMVLLGLADHRVSNTHGLAFYHALNTKKSDTELLTFPGQGHGIDGVEEARAVFEATRQWYQRRRNAT